MKRVMSEVSVQKTLRMCWDLMAPVKFVINGVTIWDDYTCELSPFEIEKCVVDNPSYENMFVKNIKIKVVDFHHTEIYIKTG